MYQSVVLTGAYLVILVLDPSLANAASFEGSLQSLVGAVVGKIMPILALPFVAKNVFGYIQGDPVATQQTPKVALGVVALIGINAVWGFLQSHVH